MDGTMSNVTWWNTIATTSDTNSVDYTTVWFDDFTFTSWLPYKYEQYTPKWHIDQGYKNQIKHMWDG